MSVLIEGMKMPKAEFGSMIVAIRPDGMVEDVMGCYVGKAVPVQSHGRLIDADAFIEKCEEMADKEDGNQLDALVLLRWFIEQNAPTVIPASDDLPKMGE